MTCCMVGPIFGSFFRGRFSTRKGEAENMANRSYGHPWASYRRGQGSLAGGKGGSILTTNTDYLTRRWAVGPANSLRQQPKQIKSAESATD